MGYDIVHQEVNNLFHSCKSMKGQIKISIIDFTITIVNIFYIFFYVSDSKMAAHLSPV